MSSRADNIALGMDIGGTSSRATVLDAQGSVVGTGHAGGGNPVSRPPAEAIGAIISAAREALRGKDPACVAGVVIGMAGGSVTMGEEVVDAQIEAGLREIGLRVAHHRISDVTLAFVAGTRALDGSVLIAGTGAVAGNIRDRKPIRYADGHGWLLGDRGSGVWIGRRAVECVLSTVDGRRELSAMHNAVLEWLEAPAQRDSIYAAVYGKAPAALAGLAGIVLTAAAHGDGEAARILVEASSELLATAARVRDRPDEPLVLAGGLLTGENPLATQVLIEAALRWPDADITVAGNTAEAAARLALSACVSS